MKLPQLSLRDLFWLVLVAALGFGWILDRTNLYRRVTDLEWRESIRRLDDSIERANRGRTNP